mgnify:CR=1 FL=1
MSTIEPLASHDTALVVRVFSFSYKKGLPADESGNGGGYVFDCRSTHNPGRYEPYKQLTGLDQPVIDFLEEDGEIVTFLEHVYALADTHVERYIVDVFVRLHRWTASQCVFCATSCRTFASKVRCRGATCTPRTSN